MISTLETRESSKIDLGYDMVVNMSTTLVVRSVACESGLNFLACPRKSFDLI